MKLKKEKIKVVKEYFHFKCDECHSCLELDITDIPRLEIIEFTCPICNKEYYISAMDRYNYNDKTYKKLD